LSQKLTNKTVYALAAISDVSGGIPTFSTVAPGCGIPKHAGVLIAASSPTAISWHCPKNGFQALRRGHRREAE
jgi:hypothetical protein